MYLTAKSRRHKMLILDLHTYVRSKENQLTVQVEEGNTRGRYVCVSDEISKPKLAWRAPWNKKLPIGVITEQYGDGMEIEWKRPFVVSDSGTYVCTDGRTAVAKLQLEVICKFMLSTNFLIR